MKITTIAALSLLALSFLPSSASASRTAGAGGDGCSACGPAPCCIVLTIVWCGCPFANAAASAVNTIQNKCSPLPPKGTVMYSNEINAFLGKLDKAKGRVSCAEPRAIKAL